MRIAVSIVIVISKDLLCSKMLKSGYREFDFSGTLKLSDTEKKGKLFL